MRGTQNAPAVVKQLHTITSRYLSGVIPGGTELLFSVLIQYCLTQNRLYVCGGEGVFITTLDNNLSITQKAKFIKTSYMIMSLSSRTDLCVDKYHSISGDNSVHTSCVQTTLISLLTLGLEHERPKDKTKLIKK